MQAGDVVLATDPETGETGPREVLTPIVGEGLKNLIQITIDTDGDAGDQTGTLIATDNHPFWAPEPRDWIAAEDLRSGDILQTSVGAKVHVLAVRDWTTHQRVHNLTVDGLHTYYVSAGSVPVLVHNADVGSCPVSGLPHGKLGEAATLQRLQNEGYTSITPEVRFRTAGGTDFRADFVARNATGDWVAIESKTGRVR